MIEITTPAIANHCLPCFPASLHLSRIISVSLEDVIRDRCSYLHPLLLLLQTPIILKSVSTNLEYPVSSLRCVTAHQKPIVLYYPHHPTPLPHHHTHSIGFGEGTNELFFKIRKTEFYPRSMFSCIKKLYSLFF